MADDGYQGDSLIDRLDRDEKQFKDRVAWLLGLLVSLQTGR